MRRMARWLTLLALAASLCGCPSSHHAHADATSASPAAHPCAQDSATGVPASPAPPEEREGFPVARSVPAALDPVALGRLKERAAATKSAALIVVQGGAIVVEEYFGGDPDRARLAMSVSKSVTALGLGTLAARGVLDLDTPLSAKLVPELTKTDKAGITLRHLMGHVSGLPTTRAGAKAEDWQAKTIEAHVLGAKADASPGAAFVYNNNAVDFLSVIARRASPEHVYFDDWLHLGLFGKLGVQGAFWSKDAKGDPRASGELGIRPIDLAKLGQLVLDGGTWQGQEVVPAAWIRELLAPGQSLTDQCGLLWWRDGRPGESFLNDHRLGVWKKVGVEASVLSDVQPLRGKTFPTRTEALAALEKVLGPERLAATRRLLTEKKARLFEQKTDVIAYRADGWLGQYVVVVPSAKLVAVRMRDPRETSWEPGELDYADFRWDVLDVARVGVPVDERM